MKYRTDDAAVRVEFVFHGLPGEARWQQWVRGYKFGAVVVPGCGAMGWAVASILGASPLALVLTAVLSAAAGATALAGALWQIGRYETPTTPMAYRMWQLRQEATAPRTPTTPATAAPAATVAQFGPVSYAPERHHTTTYRSRCVRPDCADDPQEDRR